MASARGGLLTVGVLFGGTLASLMEPTGAGAERATRLLVSIFSITGGVVLGTVVLLGDPSVLLQGSARLVYWQIKDIRRRLDRLALLFACYILAMACIVIAALVSDLYPTLAGYLIRCSVGVGVCALVCSLGVPFEYLRIQRTRLDRGLEQRREEDKHPAGLRPVA